LREKVHKEIRHELKPPNIQKFADAEFLRSIIDTAGREYEQVILDIVPDGPLRIAALSSLRTASCFLSLALKPPEKRS